MSMFFICPHVTALNPNGESESAWPFLYDRKGLPIADGYLSFLFRNHPTATMPPIMVSPPVARINMIILSINSGGGAIPNMTQS